MNKLRVTLAAALVAGILAGCSWLHPAGSSIGNDRLTVYYTKVDGSSLGTWNVSLRPQQSGESAAEHLHNVALYGAVAAVAGPPADVQAIRFPVGTRVLGTTVNGSTATVDLSNEITGQSGGSFGENGEFKELVYTLTGIPGISAVQITIAGHTLPTLPGGHFELDTPLRRSDW
ncbi:MAG: GerMN domain-containing protein [Candidatus Eremiobacteraeota bacterium]|nr:GerMN domain-containing protein [Candidatus Eremiobacteraeota bacterium]